jgi:hypothetical protein
MEVKDASLLQVSLQMAIARNMEKAIFPQYLIDMYIYM